MTTTVAAVKEIVLKEWPKDFSGPTPTDVGEVRLILNGKVLENGKTLADSRTPTGMLVTCHLLIQPKPEPSKGGGDGKAESKTTKCACVIQ